MGHDFVTYKLMLLTNLIVKYSSASIHIEHPFTETSTTSFKTSSTPFNIRKKLDETVYQDQAGFQFLFLFSHL